MQPNILRSRVALVALLSIFLIPIGLSSLRGLTHILTCSEEVATPFTVIFEDDTAIVLSSVAITIDDAEPTLCDGILVDVQASTPTPQRAELTLIVTNTTEFPWRGTINLELSDQGVMGRTSIPITIGRVESQQFETESILVSLEDGAHEFSGQLLLGP